MLTELALCLGPARLAEPEDHDGAEHLLHQDGRPLERPDLHQVLLVQRLQSLKHAASNTNPSSTQDARNTHNAALVHLGPLGRWLELLLAESQVHTGRKATRKHKWNLVFCSGKTSRSVWDKLMTAGWGRESYVFLRGTTAHCVDSRSIATTFGCQMWECLGVFRLFCAIKISGKNCFRQI